MMDSRPSSTPCPCRRQFRLIVEPSPQRNLRLVRPVNPSRIPSSTPVRMASRQAQIRLLSSPRPKLNSTNAASTTTFALDLRPHSSRLRLRRRKIMSLSYTSSRRLESSTQRIPEGGCDESVRFCWQIGLGLRNTEQSCRPLSP